MANRRLAHASFFTQVREEPRRHGQERVADDPWSAPPRERWHQQGDELLNGGAERVAHVANTLSAAADLSRGNPVRDKGFDVLGKFFECPASSTPDELREPFQNGDA